MGAGYAGTNYCCTDVSVQLPPPKHPYKLKINKSQSSARTLGGAFYVYDRDVITRSHSLIFPKATLSQLNQILDLFDGSIGGQSLFYWTDHLAVVRTVKLQDKISAMPTSNIYFTVSLTLVEQY